MLGDERIESRTLIWAAGVAASPAAAWLGIAPARGGRVPVMSDLSLPGKPEVFVIGDTAPAPFRYRNLGNLATIGRKEAVVDFGRLQLTGRFAWLVWGLAHIYFL